VELKEIKKLADALDEGGKQELVYFLQSRMKPLSAPIRAIDEIQEQKHKGGLVLSTLRKSFCCTIWKIRY
jgi:hypothetical protein